MLLAGHVIVCGLDGIGVTIVDLLHRGGQQVVVLSEYADGDPAGLGRALVVALVGPRGGLEQTLEAAGIATAARDRVRGVAGPAATSRSPCRHGT